MRRRGAPKQRQGEEGGAHLLAAGLQPSNVGGGVGRLLRHMWSADVFFSIKQVHGLHAEQEEGRGGLALAPAVKGHQGTFRVRPSLPQRKLPHMREARGRGATKSRDDRG